MFVKINDKSDSTATGHNTFIDILNTTHLAHMNARGHARSRHVLQPTNGGDRKDFTSSRAVAVRMAVKGAL